MKTINDGEETHPEKRKDRGSRRKNIYDFGSEMRKAANKIPSLDVSKMKTSQISHLVFELERAINSIEPMMGKVGCEHAKVIVSLYRWALTELRAILDSPVPPDTARIKSVCELLRINVGVD